MRERLSLDRNWRFALGHAADASKDHEFARDRALVKAGEGRGAANPKFEDSAWRVVNVPHDWAIELPLDERGDKELCEHGFFAIGPDHPEHSVGWYRRTFEITSDDLGRRISVEFDGVFRDSVVWINGHRLGRHASGYVPFSYDLTDMLNYGGANVLTVRVDATNWEGWWYEGAGIYRHVWLVKTDPVHVARWGTVVTSRLTARRRGAERATVTIRTRVANEWEAPVTVRLESDVVGPDGAVVGRAVTKGVRINVAAEREVVQRVVVKNARPWSCEEPNLYRVESRVVKGSREVDRFETTFGIRTLKWDAKRGFFLNGRPVKIKGTCNHQQHAGVGVAVPERLHEWRLVKLKELGSNAYRCSHYCATPELLDLCDRMGFLVMAENRLAGSSPEVLGQFETMIRRDRNHPSIILWSIANEEHTVQWAAAGERIGWTMVKLAHRLDPTRQVTAAMHDRGLGEGFANIVDVHGWNYIHVGNIGAFHMGRPRQPIVGSEEGSTVCTRGIYADDPARGYVRAYDERTPKWGSTAEHWWTFFAERQWLAGGFVWTGFDYLGEPIPYKWPCTASHFGLMDLCGFPKDNYYYYRAWWKPEEPVVHLLPHWNWEGHEGREIDVRCFTNAERVELRLNGRVVGEQVVPKNSHVGWKVPYEAGVLEAWGYRGKRRVGVDRVVTAKPAAQLRVTAGRKSVKGDGEDLVVVEVAAADAEGNFVPTAGNLIEFEVDGPGQIIGVGNGDPSSHEPHNGTRRTLFNGLAMALVQSTGGAGGIRVVARAAGVAGAETSVRATRMPRRPGVP